METRKCAYRMYWTANRKIHTPCEILLQNTSLKEFTASNRNRRWKLDPFLQSEAISNIAISMEWRFGCVSVIKTGQNLSSFHLLYVYIENRQNNGVQDAILILRQPFSKDLLGEMYIWLNKWRKPLSSIFARLRQYTTIEGRDMCDCLLFFKAEPTNWRRYDMKSV